MSGGTELTGLGLGPGFRETRRVAAGILALACLTTGVPHAGAYEFEATAQTIGQVLDVRSFRLLSGHLSLDRRRFMQSLSLNIWNIGTRRTNYSLYEPAPRGPKISLSTHMRVDHDYGSYVGGEVTVGNQIFDAIDVVPELEESLINLDVLFAYVAAEDLLNGLVDVYIGRQLNVDTLDWWSMDGVTAAIRTPWKSAIEAFGGFRVRDSSYVAGARLDPDGTSEGECAEYVEDAVPGSGAWRPIDRSVFGDNSRFRNDFDVCPQREQWMPTFGAAIESLDVKHLFARLSYRRSISRSPGIIDDPERFDYTDTGFYPNEVGQAPAWGANEERLGLTLRGTLALGKAELQPYGAVRYSLLHGLVDEAHAGLRGSWGMHSVEPEVFYSFPTFDGDSIFNVFSAEPYFDMRLTYTVAPRQSPVQGFVRGWGRQFESEGAEMEPAVHRRYAAGVQAGARYQFARRSSLRLDGFHEDGYGGRRSGGYGTARMALTESWSVGGRLSIIDYKDEFLAEFDGLSYGVQLGTTYNIFEGIVVRLVGEDNHNRFYDHQLRLMTILDLAFTPET